MEAIVVLFVLLIVTCLASGPIALIIALVALGRTRRLMEHPPLGLPQAAVGRPVHAAMPVPAPAVEPRPTPMAAPIRTSPEPAAVSEAAVAAPLRPGRDEVFREAVARIAQTSKRDWTRTAGTLEERIGTRWILIAGVITVFAAAAFFVKYAYDSGWIGPLGRVVIVAVGGFVALGVGEITRRRGYGIVAQGVTALGFALLYAAVFSACVVYHLIGATPAYILAVAVTIVSMVYAVRLDDVAAAFLSLLGGFLTPVFLSSGRNLPNPLFSYVLILGVGAVLCAYHRKWRVIDWLAFVGTFTLYIGWFEKFYRPTMRLSQGAPEQMDVALAWLTVFFAVYLVLPVLHGLVRRIPARREDVVLVLTNASVTFYMLWTILFHDYRSALAACAVGLFVIHLAAAALARLRCPQDVNLRIALTAVALLFLTLAIPLHLRLYAVAVAWAAQGVVLAIIGIRYRSWWTQGGALVALMLSLGKLIDQLPMHHEAFRVVLNPAFGTWVMVAACIAVCHVAYRLAAAIDVLRRQIAEVLYCVAVLFFMVAFMQELWWHCRYNLADGAMTDVWFTGGMIAVFTVFPLLFALRPLSPDGVIGEIVGVALAGAGAMYTISQFPAMHERQFIILANAEFAVAAAFVVGLFILAVLYAAGRRDPQTSHMFGAVCALGAVVVLWVLLTEEIWLYFSCRNRYGPPLAHWRLVAHMCISVTWALYGAAAMAIGFYKHIPVLRYMALGLFVLLLGKVFIIDMSTVKNVYRIAAFLATGVTLVGVSYAYQYLRKQGFFDAVLGPGPQAD